jgi:hypothetical protein
VSGRLLVGIIDRHLRSPLRHAERCVAKKCVKGCDIDEYEAALASPVLSSEVAAAQREEQRMQALARGEFPD